MNLKAQLVIAVVLKFLGFGSCGWFLVDGFTKGPEWFLVSFLGLVIGVSCAIWEQSVQGRRSYKAVVTHVKSLKDRRASLLSDKEEDEKEQMEDELYDSFSSSSPPTPSEITDIIWNLGYRKVK